MNDLSVGNEIYMTVEELAVYLKLASQTIRKYVLNKSIPYRKVKKSVRFRLSEIERWIDGGGGNCDAFPIDDREGDLFAEDFEDETGETVAAVNRALEIGEAKV